MGARAIGTAAVTRGWRRGRPSASGAACSRVLIQNASARVRRLVGRYLWVRVELFGDGRSGPDIAALRAYASRFDYAEHYLPRLYREVVLRRGRGERPASWSIGST